MRARCRKRWAHTCCCISSQAALGMASAHDAAGHCACEGLPIEGHQYVPNFQGIHVQADDNHDELLAAAAAAVDAEKHNPRKPAARAKKAFMRPAGARRQPAALLSGCRAASSIPRPEGTPVMRDLPASLCLSIQLDVQWDLLRNRSGVCLLLQCKTCLGKPCESLLLATSPANLRGNSSCAGPWPGTVGADGQRGSGDHHRRLSQAKAALPGREARQW